MVAIIIKLHRFNRSISQSLMVCQLVGPLIANAHRVCYYKSVVAAATADCRNDLSKLITNAWIYLFPTPRCFGQCDPVCGKLESVFTGHFSMDISNCVRSENAALAVRSRVKLAIFILPISFHGMRIQSKLKLKLSVPVHMQLTSILVSNAQNKHKHSVAYG